MGSSHVGRIPVEALRGASNVVLAGRAGFTWEEGLGALKKRSTAYEHMMAASVCVFVYGSNDLQRWETRNGVRRPVSTDSVLSVARAFLDYVFESRIAAGLPPPRVHVLSILTRPEWGPERLKAAAAIDSGIEKDSCVASLIRLID